MCFFFVWCWCGFFFIVVCFVLVFFFAFLGFCFLIFGRVYEFVFVIFCLLLLLHIFFDCGGGVCYVLVLLYFWVGCRSCELIYFCLAICFYLVSFLWGRYGFWFEFSRSYFLCCTFFLVF